MYKSRILLSICALFTGATFAYTLTSVGAISVITLTQLPTGLLFLYCITCLVPLFAWVDIFMRNRRILRRV